MLVFGSTAMQHWLGDIGRVPKDIDYLGQGRNSLGIEFHWCDEMQYVVDNNLDKTYVDLDFLYTIKLSHVPWKGNNGKWVQHLRDIARMKDSGAAVDEYLYNILYQRWGKMFGEKKVNLNQKNEVFFNTNVDRSLNHDKLHELLSYGVEPIYKKFIISRDKPLVDRDKFSLLTDEDKFLSFIEELYVIATERFILQRGSYSIRFAKAKALQLLITSLSKGWWNMYVCQNAVDIMQDKYGFDEHFFNKINEIRSKCGY